MSSAFSLGYQMPAKATSNPSSAEPTISDYVQSFSAIPTEPVGGWPTVSQLMTDFPQFRNLCRFSDLNIKSLLYYQVELYQLRMELQEQEVEDHANVDHGQNSGRYSSRADFLIRSEYEGTHKQWDLVVKMRKVLKEYNEAILQYTRIAKIPTADASDVKTFRRWLVAQVVTDKDDDHFGEFLIGGNGEQHIWGNIYELEKPLPLKQRLHLLFQHLVAPRYSNLDLISLDPNAKKPRKKELDFLTDRIFKWVYYDWLPFYQQQKQAFSFLKWPWRCLNICHLNTKKRINSIRKTKAEEDEEKADHSAQGDDKIDDDDNNNRLYLPGLLPAVISFVNTAFTTALASSFPISAIAVLNVIDSTGQKIAVVAGFTAFFAAVLTMAFGVKRVKAFTATAAFSAVLVVFIR